jgi:hypothetical protein
VLYLLIAIPWLTIIAVIVGACRTAALADSIGLTAGRGADGADRRPAQVRPARFVVVERGVGCATRLGAASRSAGAFTSSRFGSRHGLSHAGRTAGLGPRR